MERRQEWKELAEVRSTAERALTLIGAHEQVCTLRYIELKKTGESVASAMKWVHIGMGIAIATQFLVGIYIAVALRA